MDPTDEINALFGLRDRYREGLSHPNPEVAEEAEEALREVKRDIRDWYNRNPNGS